MLSAEESRKQMLYFKIALSCTGGGINEGSGGDDDDDDNDDDKETDECKANGRIIINGATCQVSVIKKKNEVLYPSTYNFT